MENPQSPEGTPSTASLFLLFADEVLPPDKAMTRGFKVPGKNAKVGLVALARLLVASTLWSMRERGLVTLAVGQEDRKALLRKKVDTVVRVERTGRESGGIEGVGAALVPAEGTTARWIARAFVGPGTPHPGAQLVRRFVDLAASENVVVHEGGGPFELVLKVHPPAPERVAALRPVFLQARDGWMAFRDREAELCDRLLEDCKRGIDTQTDSFLTH